MMLAPSVVELLDGLRRMRLERRSEYLFVGVDSSFSVRFRRDGQRIALRCGAQQLDSVDATTLCQAIFFGAKTFFAQPENRLHPEDITREDLQAALSAFGHFLR